MKKAGIFKKKFCQGRKISRSTHAPNECYKQRCRDDGEKMPFVASLVVFRVALQGQRVRRWFI